jgi:GNAT superfamily N-acetyltransferase
VLVGDDHARRAPGAPLARARVRRVDAQGVGRDGVDVPRHALEIDAPGVVLGADAAFRNEIIVEEAGALRLQADEAAGGAQIGFARVITDYAITAHIADVYNLPAYRGRGLSKWLVQAILDHPELALVWRFTLNTDDAHGLYAQFGFKSLSKPEAMMERWRGQSW